MTESKECGIHGKNCNGDCIDPNIENGMTTKTWGPPGWFFLHSVAFGYPYRIDIMNPKHKYKKHQYSTFYRYIGTVLPCKYCRESYMEFMRLHPVENHLDTRSQLCKWLYDIHNLVNDKLGVSRDCRPTFNEHQNKYEQYRAKCKKTTQEERENNIAKGCVTPANGKKNKCIIKIVETDKGDITRRYNATTQRDTETADDYLIIHKHNLIGYSVGALLFIIIGLIISKYIFHKKGYYIAKHRKMN